VAAPGRFPMAVARCRRRVNDLLDLLIGDIEQNPRKSPSPMLFRRLRQSLNMRHGWPWR
jgi:hypothetical protein